MASSILELCMDALMSSLHETLQRGFQAFRIAGDASWAINDPDHAAACSIMKAW